MSTSEQSIQSIRPDDTLRFKLFAQKIIPQEDARITVEVHALMSTVQNDQGVIEQKIRAVLNEFIDVDWTFSTIRRGGDAVGYERVTLNASARVRIAAIYNLEERARRASKEGLSLKHPKVDYSLPSQRISDVVQDLRKKIVEDVKVQVTEFDQITGRSWRIGDIAFGLKNSPVSRGTSKGAYRASDEYLADEDIFSDWDNAGVTSAERISLVAEVTLRAVAPVFAE